MEFTVEQLVGALQLADVSYLVTPTPDNKEKLKTKVTIVEGTIPSLSYKGPIMYLTDNPQKGALPLNLNSVDI